MSVCVCNFSTCVVLFSTNLYFLEKKAPRLFFSFTPVGMKCNKIAVFFSFSFHSPLPSPPLSVCPPHHHPLPLLSLLLCPPFPPAAPWLHCRGSEPEEAAGGGGGGEEQQQQQQRRGKRREGGVAVDGDTVMPSGERRDEP